MAKIDILGTLTIAANTSMSAAMSKSVFDNYEALAIFPPAKMPSTSGSATLIATFETQSYVSASVSSSSPFAGAININDWYVVKNTAGSNVTIASGTVATVASIPFENITISQPAPTGDLIYTVMGQQEVAITGLAALSRDDA